jgi:hypothetical protein
MSPIKIFFHIFISKKKRDFDLNRNKMNINLVPNPILRVNLIVIQEKILINFFFKGNIYEITKIWIYFIHEYPFT